MKRLTLLFVLSMLAACGHDVPSTTPGVRIALNWFPEHEHGGYYAALAGGVYASAGVAVQLLPGGPGAPVIARVANGDVEFGVLNADDVVQARAAGAPLVAVFAPIQTNPWCVMVHRSSGVERLADLRDVTLAMQVAGAQYQFLRRHVPLTGVTVVPYTGSIAAFLLDPHMAQQAYVFSEPILAAAKGGDPRCLLLADLGFDPYGSVLVTREDRIAGARDLVRRVVEASAAGWRQYLADPTAANASILAVNPEIGAETLAAGAKALRPLVETGAAVGSMTRERWAALIGQLREVEAIEKVPAAETCFAADMLPSG